MLLRNLPRYTVLLFLFATVACGAPPSKEMDQAEGAIDAARAAGAEQYAMDEYSAATEALRNANEAVGLGDYRLALSHALESREHAQNAARDSAESKARVRADVERTTTSISALLATTRSRLEAVRSTRIGADVLTQAAAEIAAAEGALQESGEAVTAGDYLAARRALEGVGEQVSKTLAMLNAAPAPGRARPSASPR